ncbi:hypothetical protein [Streptomyces sp. NPDC101234]|uniref:hypothetical protein n=1 Tax=Streptomyces sp. NPDC101234 TaxID=3366138 RepID=UPI0037F71794
MNAHHSIAAHRLLTETHNRLSDHPDQSVPPLDDLLAQLVVELYDHDRLGGRTRSLGGTVDEAAACLLNLATPQRVTSPFDEDLRTRMRDLDRRPLPERLLLLKAAVRRTRL